MISFDFSGRVTVVTGAGGGIGGEIAKMLLDAGGIVVMIDTKPEPEGLPGPPEQRGGEPAFRGLDRGDR